MNVPTFPLARLVALIAAIVGIVALILGAPDTDLLWGCVFVALGGLALS